MSTEPFSDADRVARMMRGLEEAPKHVGLSFRAIPDDAPTPYPGMAVVATWIVPTSLDPMVATGNRARRRLYAVVGDAGADIGAFSSQPQEREVAYLAGTMFVAGPTETMHGYTVTFVEQVDTSRAAGRAEAFGHGRVREGVDLLLGSLDEREPVSVPHPDKFVGELG